MSRRRATGEGARSAWATWRSGSGGGSMLRGFRRQPGLGGSAQDRLDPCGRTLLGGQGRAICGTRFVSACVRPALADAGSSRPMPPDFGPGRPHLAKVCPESGKVGRFRSKRGQHRPSSPKFGPEPVEFEVGFPSDLVRLRPKLRSDVELSWLEVAPEEARAGRSPFLIWDLLGPPESPDTGSARGPTHRFSWHRGARFNSGGACAGA